jgi:hypothetical protein
MKTQDKNIISERSKKEIEFLLKFHEETPGGTPSPGLRETIIPHESGKVNASPGKFSGL